MIALLIFFIIVVLIFCYVLFAPFYFEINSITNKYGFRFHKFLYANIHITEKSLLLNIKIAGWRKQIDLLNQNIKPSKGKIKKERGEIPIGKIYSIIKSFKVNKFYLNLSFENMALNGVLFPFFSVLKSKTNKNIQINFWNKNEIVIEVENNFYRIIKAYINS